MAELLVYAPRLEEPVSDTPLPGVLGICFLVAGNVLRVAEYVGPVANSLSLDLMVVNNFLALVLRHKNKKIMK